MDIDIEWRLRQDAKESEIWRRCVDQIDWILRKDDPVILLLAGIREQVDTAADKVAKLRRGEDDEWTVTWGDG
jgi:hypothetical protein